MDNNSRVTLGDNKTFTGFNDEGEANWQACCEGGVCSTVIITKDSTIYCPCGTPAYVDRLDDAFGTNFRSLIKWGSDLIDMERHSADFIKNSRNRKPHFCRYCRRNYDIRWTAGEMTSFNKDEWIDYAT